MLILVLTLSRTETDELFADKDVKKASENCLPSWEQGTISPGETGVVDRLAAGLEQERYSFYAAGHRPIDDRSAEVILTFRRTSAREKAPEAVRKVLAGTLAVQAFTTHRENQRRWSLVRQPSGMAPIRLATIVRTEGRGSEYLTISA